MYGSFTTGPDLDRGRILIYTDTDGRATVQALGPDATKYLLEFDGNLNDLDVPHEEVSKLLDEGNPNHEADHEPKYIQNEPEIQRFIEGAKAFNLAVVDQRR